MSSSITTKQLDNEASAGWTTYGTGRAVFLLFRGGATRHESSSEKVGQTGSLPSLPERSQWMSRSKLPGSAGILACLLRSVGSCRKPAGKDACAPR